MTTIKQYGIFYDGILEEKLITTEELAKQRFAEILEVETQEGEQLYDTIDLYKLTKINEYKFVVDELETKDA